MNTLLAGVDDIASEQQSVSGWCYVVLPDQVAEAFHVESARILAKNSKLKSFHGSEFKLHFRKEYLEFLQLIRTNFEANSPVLAACVLHEAAWFDKLNGIGKKFLVETLLRIGANDADAQSCLKELVGPLVELQQLTKSFPPSKLRIVLDSQNNTKSFKDVKVCINRPLANVMCPGQYLLSAFYNSYRLAKFPTSPELLQQGIDVVNDKNWAIIQAADVIGNFVMADLYTRLGNKSKSREAKAELIAEVFGDSIKPPSLDNVTLEGNELRITNGRVDISFKLFNECSVVL